MMVKKIHELRTAVIHAYNLAQNSYGCNQAEQSYEQLHSPNSSSGMFQHKSQKDVYIPPWRTHSNWRGVEDQNQRPRDLNYNNPNFTNQQKHHHTNNNHYTPPQHPPFQPPTLHNQLISQDSQRITNLEILIERMMKHQEVTMKDQEAQ
ncbi:hypothetical protein AHAS_Ahas11G0174300 [Arachis hypogaea]